MIRRRHQIVHRADRIGGEFQPVDSGEILNWVEVTRTFMHSLLWPIFLKHYPIEVLRTKFNIASVDEETGAVVNLDDARLENP
jgi:hypothetical protein